MDWFNLFLISGTIFFTVEIIKFVWYIVDTIRMWKDIRDHEKYCEDCADELMAETIKSIRDKGNDDR